MKAYAAISTGFETEIRIFKTFEEAEAQVYAWFGQSMMDTIMDKDTDTWNDILRKVDKYEDKEAKVLSIYDDTIETEYEVKEVDIPFAVL